MVNDDFVKLQNYSEEFIFPLKHHMQSTESGIQYIATCLVTLMSEEVASNLVSSISINITPINCDIFKQDEGKKIKGNNPMKSRVGDKRQTISLQ